MTDLKTTFDVLSDGFIKKDIPEYISNNLNQNFPLREYQKEAIARFSFYLDWEKRTSPINLLFQMATGSGKTLVMAAQILELYKRGYRNFIFFVNNTNIINKTIDNFTNNLHSKYLFGEKINFDGRQIMIKSVNNFDTTGKDDISILFTTIQGLHIDLNAPKENSINYEDFKDRKIVLIADEEHHLQALTKKKLSKEEINEKTSWEYTVRRVKNSNRDNILLEFSATANLENPEIKRKYEDKLIFDYPLSQFRKDGYSKDIDVIKLDMSPLDRALQAVIISQYRKKIAEKHKIHLKPVILMKSKRISESKLFESQFISMIRNLNGEKLNHIKSESVKKAFEYFRANGITIDNLVREIKEDFNENKCRAINSKEDIEENQILINKLEDKDNKIRVIFAVDMLNEGWDVLNLFDIVRLYDTRDSGITTTREAQLIGRGARYFPFSIKGDKGDEPDRFIRKFDQDVDNELKIIEELYYHSPNNIKYIQELKQELIKSGIIPKESKSIEVRVKEGFKHTKFYEKGKIFINEQIKNERRQIHSLEVLGIKTDTPYKYELKTGISQRYAIFEENENKTIEKGYKTYLLTDFGINVIQKAIHTKDFYSFNNLSIYLPNLLSIGEFISSEKYLGKVRVEVIGSKEQITKMSPQSKLETALTILSKIEKEIINNSTEYKGSKEFYPKLISEIFTDKVMNIHIDDSGDKELGRSMKETSNELLRLDLSQKDWYVYDDNYGTSEEKYLVRFINSAIEKLKEEYNEIYLMRNQKPFKIYKFSNGKPFEPDFVLFLKEKNKQKVLLYQLFIEAKGEQLKKKDEWKETFLLSLQKEFKLKLLHEEKEMRLFGMPFYNEDNKIPFIEKFEESLKVKL